MRKIDLEQGNKIQSSIKNLTDFVNCLKHISGIIDKSNDKIKNCLLEMDSDTRSFLIKQAETKIRELQKQFDEI